MREVDALNDVVVTKNGRKMARLTPYVTDIDQYLAVRKRALDYGYSGKKVTYEEFMEIYRKSELRMEFINGEIYIISSPGVTNQRILGQLHLIFHGFFESSKCSVFFAPFDVHFRKKDVSVPDVCQPDLLVICDLEENVTEEDRYTGTPALILEILSKSTRSKDLTIKLNTYMRSGVEEYWIVDPKQKTILVYYFKNREIESYRTYEEDSVACSAHFSGLEVEPRAISS